ncbi:MAG: hypothetical protein JSS79_17175 [Bacteroidetes bacterium]|nr:hypothetical protein [Bacteroidota bacterium]
MKLHEFYTKSKTNYPTLVNPIFSKRNWWQVVLITAFAVLVEPLVLYRQQRLNSFSLDYYLKIAEYFLIILVPFVAFLMWTNWRESVKRSKGYCWMGKFEVVTKETTLVGNYIILSPSLDKMRVDRKLFEKIREGDFIQVRRDVFGQLEEIKRVNSFSSRLAKIRNRRVV